MGLGISRQSSRNRDSFDALGALFNALKGKYVSIDLSGCPNLALTSLPAGSTSIGIGAFAFCTSLVSVTFEAGSHLSSGNFGDNAFPEGYNNISGNSLRTAYLAEGGGAGTYTREANGSVWRKQ